MTRQAAADGCLRAALLRHEADHYRILDNAIDSYFRQRRDQINRGFAAATEKLAPTREGAAQMFEADLTAFLRRMVREFEKQELSGIRRGADTAANLAALRSACGGEVNELEKHLLNRQDL